MFLKIFGVSFINTDVWMTSYLISLLLLAQSFPCAPFSELISICRDGTVID